MSLHAYVDRSNKLLTNADVDTQIILPDSQLSPKDRRYYRTELLTALEGHQDAIEAAGFEDEFNDLTTELEELSL